MIFHAENDQALFKHFTPYVWFYVYFSIKANVNLEQQAPGKYTDSEVLQLSFILLRNLKVYIHVQVKSVSA